MAAPEPTPEMVLELRGMIAEPTPATYTDPQLQAAIARNPLLDAFGRDPYQPSATIPPVLEANPYWTGNWDLNLTASKIWDEKAALVADRYRFSTDNQSFDRQQTYEQAKKQARYYRALRSFRTVTAWPYPSLELQRSQIGNAPEYP